MSRAFRTFCLPIIVVVAAAQYSQASAEDIVFDDVDFAYTNPTENFVLRGSVGVTSLEGREHVYAGSSGEENLSLLLWESTAPIAKIDAKLRGPGDWTLRGHFEAAINGDSTMKDYDWTAFSPSYDFNDWDHRSISPNTSLDWYFSGDVAVGRDLPINEVLTVNLNGGFKYTDVRWTAVGGTYTYSTSGFRDTEGTIPDVAAVRYRQQLPTIFAGLDASIVDGPWSLEAGGKAGLVVYGQSTDHHYLRTPPMVIVDQLTYGQVLSGNAKLGFEFSKNLGAFVEASYEKMFSGHTPTDYYNMNTHDLMIHDDSIGGAELQVLSLTAGLKGHF